MPSGRCIYTKQPSMRHPTCPLPLVWILSKECRVLLTFVPNCAGFEILEAFAIWMCYTGLCVNYAGLLCRRDQTLAQLVKEYGILRLTSVLSEFEVTGKSCSQLLFEG